MVPVYRAILSDFRRQSLPAWPAHSKCSVFNRSKGDWIQIAVDLDLEEHGSIRVAEALYHPRYVTGTFLRKFDSRTDLFLGGQCCPRGQPQEEEKDRNRSQSHRSHTLRAPA